eukprot:272511_1
MAMSEVNTEPKSVKQQSRVEMINRYISKMTIIKEDLINGTHVLCIYSSNNWYTRIKAIIRIIKSLICIFNWCNGIRFTGIITITIKIWKLIKYLMIKNILIFIINNFYIKKPIHHYSGVVQHPFLVVLRWEIGADNLYYAGINEFYGQGMVKTINQWSINGFNQWSINGQRTNKKKEEKITKKGKKDFMDGDKEQGQKMDTEGYSNVNDEAEIVYGIKSKGNYGSPGTKYIIIMMNNNIGIPEGNILHNIVIVKDHYAAEIIINHNQRGKPLETPA